MTASIYDTSATFVATPTSDVTWRLKDLAVTRRLVAK